MKERFGYNFVLSQKVGELTLLLPGRQGSISFDNLQEVFHQSRSDFSCEQWRASVEGFKGPIEDTLFAPSSTELSAPLIELCDQGAIIHYDILGLAYWMLSRLEEIGRTDLDEHQRFPAVSSHAYKHNYLERPIIDEWMIILGQVIQQVWPQTELRRHEFSVKVSHDVDTPSQYAFKPWPTIGRMMAGYLLKRREFKAFFTAPHVKLATGAQLHPADPYNTFDWLMDVSEANNIQSAFYFLCGRTSPVRDSDYELEYPAIRNLIRRIHDRGHEIGLHPSYGTFQKPELIKQEADRLKRVCAELGIVQTEWGGRMHYLRWEQPTTLRAWENCGMSYDSTLGYADSPGFRCGTCYEYPAFDPVAQTHLRLRIRPLVVMECSVISCMYLGLRNSDEALKKVTDLKKKCRKVNGLFTLLWHNSYFDNKELFGVYKKALQC
ncbi:polysaccharide deacetylase family protein [Billgrantia gudaonensis]|uniref:polysaccharide deacetylase family protein n=1 Tax=Billgrantia gudaonensis TaxID=376427 RepID=UPI001C408ECF|nr:polysaccharide deacetylase family protein [Halomonas gudaonensis]